MPWNGVHFRNCKLVEGAADRRGGAISVATGFVLVLLVAAVATLEPAGRLFLEESAGAR
jgi:hypothetical protein